MKWRPKEGAGWRKRERRSIEGSAAWRTLLLHFSPLCVCVCVLHATPVGSCLICWWISQSAAQTTRRSRGEEWQEGRQGEEYKAQGQKVLNASVGLEAICCTSTFSCSCSCNVFASLKAATSCLRTHSSKFWLMIECSSSRSSHSSSSSHSSGSATDEQQLLNDRSSSKGNNFKFFPFCVSRFASFSSSSSSYFTHSEIVSQSARQSLLNFHFPLETLTCNLTCPQLPSMHAQYKRGRREGST